RPRGVAGCACVTLGLLPPGAVAGVWAGAVGVSSTGSTAESPDTLVSSWCLTLPGDWLGCLDGVPGMVEHQLDCGVAGYACVKLVLDTPRGLTRVSAWVYASDPGGHVGGVEVSHAGDEVDHAHVACVQPPILPRGVVAQQVQDPAVLETQVLPGLLFVHRAAEGFQQGFQGAVGADLMQGLALVLEDPVAGDALGFQYAALGGVGHMADQIPRQGAGQQRGLLCDKGFGGGVDQVLDGLAPQDRQFAPG